MFEPLRVIITNEIEIGCKLNSYINYKRNIMGMTKQLVKTKNRCAAAVYVHTTIRTIRYLLPT